MYLLILLVYSSHLKDFKVETGVALVWKVKRYIVRSSSIVAKNAIKEQVMRCQWLD